MIPDETYSKNVDLDKFRISKMYSSLLDRMRITTKLIKIES